MSEWGEISLGEGCEILDSLRVPLNADERDGIKGDVPYYGANGLQGYINKAIFDEPLILLAEDGGYFDEYETRPIAYRISGPSWVNNHAHILRVKKDGELDQDFTFYCLQHKNITPFIKGGTRAKLNQSELRGIVVPKPPPNTQRRIATILTTLDEVIEATEKLVEKHQQIKAGLMHDLFTRGLWTRPELARGDHKGLPCESTAQEGQLRPTPEEAPGLYQNSPLGLIPKAWKLSSIGEIAESVADGPFGSNLKTEHYVVEPGVRVVRLQNIHDTIYNDEDRAFVSESHANYLIRNQVVSGDILVAGLGEDKHVVARACCYPYGLPPAINKADCFRLRCDSEKALNSFVMFYLNTSIARGQARRYEQGVTRRRINGGNLKRILFGLPSLPEQKKAIAMLDSAGSDIDSITEQVAKLRQQKQGLMHDLLTGRVRVADS